MAKVEYEVVRSEKLSEPFDDRYVVISKATGEILDDAQGYGYRTARKAHAGFAYKNRDKSKDEEKARRHFHILKWMKHHKNFMETLEQYAFEIAKGSWGPDDVVDEKFVQEMFDQYGLKPDFSAKEFLLVWSKPNRWKMKDLFPKKTPGH